MKRRLAPCQKRSLKWRATECAKAVRNGTHQRDRCHMFRKLRMIQPPKEQDVPQKYSNLGLAHSVRISIGILACERLCGSPNNPLKISPGHLTPRQRRLLIRMQDEAVISANHRSEPKLSCHLDLPLPASHFGTRDLEIPCETCGEPARHHCLFYSWKDKTQIPSCLAPPRASQMGSR